MMCEKGLKGVVCVACGENTASGRSVCDECLAVANSKKCDGCPDRCPSPNCHDVCPAHLKRTQIIRGHKKKEIVSRDARNYIWENVSRSLHKNWRKVPITCKADR